MSAQPPTVRLRFLIVAATFPPRGGSSVQRVAKFAKYAKRAGHEPMVITTSYQGKLADPSLMADLPAGLEVHRVAPDPVNRGRLGRLLSRYSYPDSYRAWGRAAVKMGQRIVRAQAVDAVFVSFGAPSAMFAGATLARRYGLPLILDIRDMWTITDKRTRRNRPGTFVGWVDRMLERRAWKAVNHFTVVSAGYRRTLIDSYGVAPQRVTTIYNGFDPEDLPPGASLCALEQPTIRFAGFVTELQGFAQLVTAVGQVNERRRRASAPELRFEIMGDNAPDRLSSVLSGPWPEWLILHRYRPHAEAIRFMQQASILALFQPADRGMLTGKFFEYAGTRRPILHLDNRTDELRDLIAANGLGLSAPQSDVDTVALAIEKLLDESADFRGKLPEGFRRDTQARQFLDVLQRTVQAGRRTADR